MYIVNIERACFGRRLRREKRCHEDIADRVGPDGIPTASEHAVHRFCSLEPTHRGLRCSVRLYSESRTSARV